MKKTHFGILTGILLACATLTAIMLYPTHAQTQQIKKYRALITQEGENAPTARVILNTLGDIPQWSRDAEGTYRVTLEDAFSGNVIFYIPGSEEGFENSHILVREIHNDYILVISEAADGTGRGVDSILGQVTGRGTPIDITVYPESLNNPTLP